MNSLAEITSKLVGKKYELGKCDCLSLVIDYLKMRGFKIADDIKFEGLTLANYKDAYLKDASIVEKAVRFFKTFCNEIEISNSLAGDILFLEDIDGAKFLGIDGGNGKILTALIGKRIELIDEKSNCKRLKVLRIG